MSKESDLITLREAAELKGLSKVRIHQCIQEGKLKKVEKFGRVLVFRKEVLAMKTRLKA